MVCAQKGYPLVVTMAESFSVERHHAAALPRHAQSC
jgi:cysteine synthase